MDKIKIDMCDDKYDKYLDALLELSKEAPTNRPFYTPQVVRELVEVTREALQEIELLRKVAADGWNSWKAVDIRLRAAKKALRGE